MGASTRRHQSKIQVLAGPPTASLSWISIRRCLDYWATKKAVSMRAPLKNWMRERGSDLRLPAENEELAALVIPNFFPGMLRNTFSQQTKLTQLMVACALERHRLVSGVLPEELDELVPHYIEEVPIDVFSGQGLHYLRDGDGYVIWSVGWDGENDGGRPVAEKDGARGYDSGEGDWVWRYDPPE